MFTATLVATYIGWSRTTVKLVKERTSATLEANYDKPLSRDFQPTKTCT